MTSPLLFKAFELNAVIYSRTATAPIKWDGMGHTLVFDHFLKNKTFFFVKLAISFCIFYLPIYIKLQRLTVIYPLRMILLIFYITLLVLGQILNYILIVHGRNLVHSWKCVDNAEIKLRKGNAKFALSKP